MAAENYPRRRSDVNIRVVDGETVVLDRQKGLIHQLNQTATYIWERCDGRSTVVEIAAQLTETFDVAYEIAIKDVVRVTRHFQDLQLLEALLNQTVFSKPQPEEALHVQQVRGSIGEGNEPKRSD
jgi:hypothetical protein